jgi:protein phosphatase 1 regulatory subunit 10
LQAERERSALGAVYMSMSQIPESPLEPNRTTTESECETKLMKLGGDMEELSTEPPKISDLLSALPQAASNIPFGTQQGVTPQLAPVVDNAALMALLGNIQNSGVPNILQQFGLSGQISNPNTDSNWQGYHPNYQEPNSGFGSSEQAQGQWDSTDGGWSERGGRGRGRGRGGRVRRGRKPCTFFAEGR